jgi:hypothetical protein
MRLKRPLTLAEREEIIQTLMAIRERQLNPEYTKALPDEELALALAREKRLKDLINSLDLDLPQKIKEPGAKQKPAATRKRRGRPSRKDVGTCDPFNQNEESWTQLKE